MNKDGISQLIYFLYNSIKANDNISMSRAEEELKTLCSTEQDTYLLIGDVLADFIFEPTIENDLHMFSIIILHRCNILRQETIITQYIYRLCQTEIFNENFPLLKQLCITISTVIQPPHIELILNTQPNYSILFIIYYYVFQKSEKNENIENSTQIFDYIVKFSLFDPTKTSIEISTISTGILTYIKSKDDRYDELILSFFSQLPVEKEYLPILFELVGSFNQTNDSYSKYKICYEKLIDFSKLETYPFDIKNILDHTISVEFIINYLIMYIYYYLDNENEEDENENEEENEKKFSIEKGELFQLSVRFCTIQDYVKERWLNDIDSFLIEIQEDLENDSFKGIDFESGFFIDFNSIPIRCHSLQIIQMTFNLTEFCNGMIELIQQNESNLSWAIKLEEVYYYVLFDFMTSMKINEKDFFILPPIVDNDILLYGEYIRCITTLGILLSNEEYIQILQPETHFILKILLAQGIVENDDENKFPNKLILNCIECLIQMIDLFQTDCDIDLFFIIKKLVLKAQIEKNDYLQIILFLKNQWLKYLNNINRIIDINSIIFDLINSIDTVPIIFDIFIPILLDTFNIEELKIQSILLFKSITKKLPFKNENEFQIQNQISESAMNAITNNIFNVCISIISNCFSNDSFDNSLFSIAAFFCRLEIVHPSFLHLIIFTIDKLKNNFIDDLSSFGQQFISFIYEYLLIQTNENIGKIEIIQKIVEFVSVSNIDDDHKIIKDNLLILSLGLFCTQNVESAIPIFNSVNDFYNVVFSFILKNFVKLQSEERFIYAIMYLLCVRNIQELNNQEMNNQISEILEISDFINDESCFLDRNDPFIKNHHIVSIPKKSLPNYFQELMSQLNN